MDTLAVDLAVKLQQLRPFRSVGEPTGYPIQMVPLVGQQGAKRPRGGFGQIRILNLAAEFVVHPLLGAIYAVGFALPGWWLSYLALLATTQKWYAKLGKKPDPLNPADPYMTLLGYFNSLRELGGARRVIEDEVRNRLAGYATARTGPQRLASAPRRRDRRNWALFPVRLPAGRGWPLAGSAELRELVW